MDRAEERLRQNFRPKIASALDDVDLTPQNPPERAAKKKMIEELLDQIVDRGFLAVGDLREKFLCLNKVYPKGFSIPKRFIGVRMRISFPRSVPITRLRFNSVGNMPGAMALTTMPCSAHSQARLRVRDKIAVFAAQ